MLLLTAFLVAFTPGERLDYDVRYGPLCLGRLSLSTLAPDTVRGESCYHFRAVLQARLSFLFSARYDIDAWCRVSDMVTLRSAKKTRESRYRAEWTADYDYGAGRVVYSDGDTLALAGPAHDVLTLWYLVRRPGFGPGDTLPVYCHSDRRDYHVALVGVRETEVGVPAGRFRCLEVVPTPGSPLGAVFLARGDASVPAVIRTSVGGVQVSAELVGTAQEEEE